MKSVGGLGPQGPGPPTRADRPRSDAFPSPPHGFFRPKIPPQNRALTPLAVRYFEGKVPSGEGGKGLARGSCIFAPRRSGSPPKSGDPLRPLEDPSRASRGARGRGPRLPRVPRGPRRTRVPGPTGGPPGDPGSGGGERGPAGGPEARRTAAGGSTISRLPPTDFLARKYPP